MSDYGSDNTVSRGPKKDHQVVGLQFSFTHFRETGIAGKIINEYMEGIHWFNLKRWDILKWEVTSHRWV